MSFKDAIARASRDTPAYDFLRDTYQRVFNRTYWRQRVQIAAFFSRFVARNDLVFDIGANAGEYTQMFVSLGARVVSVEPNPQLTAFLKRIRPFDRVKVEALAVGSARGSSELYLCDHNVLSTLSRDWVDVAEKSERFSGIKWNQKVTVPVVTLDELIEKYGRPRFIKIDVEGYENDALAGLSRVSPFLSFEVNSEFPDAAIKCLRQKCFTPESRFNLTFGLGTEFAFGNWVPCDEMVRFIGTAEFLTRKTYADILARTEA
jgi:FkbM family methyltransferase